MQFFLYFVLPIVSIIFMVYAFAMTWTSGYYNGYNEGRDAGERNAANLLNMIKQTESADLNS
jgi:hypothetical protein